ncbi:MAG: hypothetical protein FJW88_13130 [Actinobacteria bacterium]|nr:hypothetical protein [Actinomycetota bacterium]
MWDLRIALSSGSIVDAATLAATASSIPHADAVEHAEAHLIGATQVDASTPEETILVRGHLVGVVPATMELLGDANWWLPRWLDRLLPHVEVEGVTDFEETLPEPELETA